MNDIDNLFKMFFSNEKKEFMFVRPRKLDQNQTKPIFTALGVSIKTFLDRNTI